MAEEQQETREQELVRVRSYLASQSMRRNLRSWYGQTLPERLQNLARLAEIVRQVTNE